MNHAQPDELGVLEARDQSQHADLITPFQLGLEADETVVIAGSVSCRSCTTACGLRPVRGSSSPSRFHRPVAERVCAPMRHHFMGRQPSKNFPCRSREPLLILP